MMTFDWLAVFAPDDQPGDWYLWLLVATGHAMLIGGGLWAALGWLDRIPAFVLTCAIYAQWELLQLTIGGGFVDGITDWAFVVVGAALAWAAWDGNRRALVWLVLAFAAPAAIGVGLRI